MEPENAFGTNRSTVCEDWVLNSAARGEGKMFVLDKDGRLWYDIAINLGHFAPMHCDASARRARDVLPKKRNACAKEPPRQVTSGTERRHLQRRVLTDNCIAIMLNAANRDAGYALFA